MRSKEELQFDIDSLLLATNEIKTLLNIGNPAQIKQFKREVWLSYHPDNKISALEKKKYTVLFQAMQPFLNIDNSIESRIERVEQHFMHGYHVNITIADVDYSRSKWITIKIMVPFIKQTTRLNNALKEIHQLTDNDIENINEKFKMHIASFIQQLLSIKKASFFGLMFFSHQPIESDLLRLINASQDKELMQKINRLKSSTINYASFDSDCNDHTYAFLGLANDFLNRTEFQENLYKIYLNIASQHKEPPTHWLWNKENYAYLTALSFKTPAFLVLMSMLLATIFFYVLLPLAILPELFMLCAGSTIASLALVVWASSLAAAFYFEINPFDMMEKITIPIASFVDCIVDYLFAPKFFATELARNLADFTDRTTKNQTSANSYQDTFFRENNAHDEMPSAVHLGQTLLPNN